MSDVDALNERIDALEMRLTYQDVTIETLNQTITAQWVEIDKLTRLAELKERLRRPVPRAGPCERTAAALLEKETASTKEATITRT
jgi:SlyX protein